MICLVKRSSYWKLQTWMLVNTITKLVVCLVEQGQIIVDTTDYWWEKTLFFPSLLLNKNLLEIAQWNTSTFYFTIKTQGF